MATVKVKFRPSKAGNREGSLFIQIIHNRVARQLKTGHRLFPDEWDARRSEVIVPSEPEERRHHLRRLQSDLDEKTAALARIVGQLERSGEEYTSARVVEIYLSPPADGFIAFMRELIRQLNQIGKERTASSYSTTLNSFVRFHGDREAQWEEVDSKLMIRYESYLRENGICPNSSSYYMRNLRAMYNRAAESEMTQHRNPFRDVYTGIGKTVKRAVSKETVKQLRDLDLSRHPSADFARDIFMFSFYTRGMSFIDIAFLRKDDIRNGTLSYRRKKTNQLLSVKWEKQMQEIVDKHDTADSPYLLPIIKIACGNERCQYTTAAHRINRHLKAIGNRLGLTMPLTCYVARHTWASIAKNRNIPLAVISEAMGHDSESTTKIYLASLDTSEIDKANSMIINLL